MKNYEYKIVIGEAKLKATASKIYDDLMWPNVEKDAKKCLASDDFITKKAFIEMFLEEKTLKQVLDDKFELNYKEFMKTIDEVLMNHPEFKTLDKLELQRELVNEKLKEKEEREANLIRSVEALGFVVTKK